MKRWALGDALQGDETPFFLPVGDDAVAVVHHACATPRATVVLAGPMTLERTHGYLTWARWARVLVANGYDVFRFDYRGVGESTGDFRQQTFDAWLADLRAVVAHAKARGNGRVVVLGLRLGALLGKRVFDARECDAFIAWDPPVGGKPMLMDMLRRKLAADYMEFPGERKTRDDYVREFDAGATVEVEGYPWTKPLFASADAFTASVPENLGGEYLLVFLDGRTADRLPNRDFYASARVPKPAFWLQSQNLVADLDELFGLTLERLFIWSDAWLATDAKRAAVPVPVDAKHGARALHVVELPGGRCVGTHHASSGGKVGLLFVNFGYVPRDGHGGLATFVCDAMAKQGVPSFRYDLPGLGDAPGALLPKTLEFFPFVTGGAYTAVTSQLVKQLCEREGLDGVVMAGLCGGAVNALFTGDVLPDRVRGLVMFEPELYVTEPKATEGEAPRNSLRAKLKARLPASPLTELLTKRLPFEDKVRSKLFSYWGWMRLLTHENRYARYVPLPKKAILDFVLSRSELPSVTNLPLASAWQRWVEARRPALVITADGKLREVFFDRIHNKLLGQAPRANVKHVRLQHTNHIFTTGGAIQTVTDHVARAWPGLFAPNVA